MDVLLKNNIPYEQIENGALILVLIRECRTWEALCARYAGANAADLLSSTNAMVLRDKLFQMRDLGLIGFDDEEREGEGGKWPKGDIKDTGLWSNIRVAFGGMSLTEAAMLSRHSNGMAVAPVFGRPHRLEEKVDVFVLMPFDTKMEKVYTNHIKKIGDDLGLSVKRADDNFSPAPFMEKVWDGICAAQLIIADCTQKNPNVFYEIGMAHTIGKKVVLITRSEKEIPSDIKHYDYIPYVYDPEGVDQLINKLKEFMKAYFAC